MVRGRGLAWEESQDAFVRENLNMTAAIVHCFEYPQSSFSRGRHKWFQVNNLINIGPWRAGARELMNFCLTKQLLRAH